MSTLASMVHYDPDAPAYSIDRIPLLNTTEDWPEWTRRLHEFLVINKLSGVWAALDAGTSVAQRQVMELACEIVKSTSGERAYAIVKDMTNISVMHNALEREFEPKGSDAFAEAIHQFSNLEFDQFRDVKSYAKKFKGLVKQISDSGCDLPPMYINTQFVMSLSPSYEHLLTTAKNNGMIVPEAGQQMASLDQTICLALAFEQLERIKREASAEPETVLANFKQYSKVIGDERIYNSRVVHCTYCRKDRHTQHECWRLHPELKSQQPAAQEQPAQPALQQQQQRKRKATQMEMSNGESDEQGAKPSSEFSDTDSKDEKSNESSDREGSGTANNNRHGKHRHREHRDGTRHATRIKKE
ncbi:MAG: hypothetical protein LQ352_000107 [Teloschistes flavicans]|nr:MAG: hypothetical protein LQ352_000107 [Teloschistes flavicans]